MKSKLQHLLALKDEIAYLQTQTEGGGKGHYFTTISVLDRRVEDLVNELDKEK